MHRLLEQTLKVFENSGGDYSYSLIKIEIPKNVTEKILAFGMSIPNEELYEDPNDDSFGRELETHITVKYGLTTKDADEVTSIVNNENNPISVTLGDISIFEGDKTDKPYDVVKVSVESEDLNRYHKLFSDKLENKDDHSSYKPHLTIAYVKKGEGQKYVGNADFAGMTFESNELVFKTPEGDVTKIPLTDGM